MKAKITDLGMATIMDDIIHKRTIPLGNPSFIAPEVFNVATPKYSPSVDIFSFGMIMIHILCGEEPKPNYPQPEIARDGNLKPHGQPVSEADRRECYLLRIQKDHPRLIDLIRQCIRDFPKERLDTNGIVERLKDLEQPGK